MLESGYFATVLIVAATSIVASLVIEVSQDLDFEDYWLGYQETTLADGWQNRDLKEFLVNLSISDSIILLLKIVIEPLEFVGWLPA